MKPQVRLVPLLPLLLLSPLSLVLADDCQPSTWAAKGLAQQSLPTDRAKVERFESASVARIGGAVEPGEINCRYYGSTYDDVNYYTCTQLAERYEITVEQFFKLNPDVDADCGNIKPNTDYCVDGFIEPVRATDGLCGPKHKNATCLGYQGGQCCNAETWKCGNSTKTDCAAGTCYEGACVGDAVYSTDGTCGYAHGNRLCTGKWGDCCSLDGKCGTGTAFCGKDVCQSGNCTRPETPPPPPPILGNTTDGTCGGAKRLVCNVVYGNCCGKNGICGSLPSDCGSGWSDCEYSQPEFGTCSSSSSSSSSSSRAASRATAAN